MGLSGEKLIGRTKSPITSTRPGKGALGGEKWSKGRAGDEGEELTDCLCGERSGELSGADDRIFPE